jgi:hypothetical protein
MKLKIALALLACVLSGVVFTGCGDSGSTTTPPSTNMPAATSTNH